MLIENGLKKPIFQKFRREEVRFFKSVEEVQFFLLLTL
jgi:hypothetical protein